MSRHPAPTASHGPTGKQLRVLTGLHASASLQLPPGRYRLMAEEVDPADEAEEADTAQPLNFLDWSGPPCLLELRAATAGTASAARAHAFLCTDGDDSTTDAQAWDDFDPRRLGGLVICLGDADALWPADEALLARITGTPVVTAAIPNAAPSAPETLQAATLPASAPRMARLPVLRARHAAAGLGVGLLLAVSTLFGGSGPQQAVTRQPSIPMAAPDLERTLHDHGLAGLRVQQDERGLIVTGLLADAAEDAVAQRLLAPLRGPAVRLQWAVAEDLAATIDAALRAPQVRTRHLGQGRFVAEGQADSPERVRASAEQLRRDIGPALQELTVNVTAIRRTPPVTSAVAAGDLRYDERRDGTKRFGMEQR
ncbi:MAG: hypothetical protein KA795_03385 [Burkholderiaceae bacterium]|nr:hypothetical protein [Burkholderiaceae bacterium]